MTLNPKLKKLDPICLEELHVGFRIGLGTQVYDGAEAEGFEEGEVGRLGEAGAENAIINHGEVEGRNEGVLAVVCGVIGDGELDFAAHLGVLVVLGALEFCRHLHIKVST